MRRQALPLSELSVSPALRASSNEKGLFVSSVGMRGVLATPQGCPDEKTSSTHPVKDRDRIPHVWIQPRLIQERIPHVWRQRFETGKRLADLPLD